MSPRIFYTYLLIDPRTGLPFYVGKGTKNRMYQHLNSRNRRVQKRVKEIKAQGYKVKYEKLLESEDQNFCFVMEKFFIASIGLKNLLNRTNGGQGSAINHVDYNGSNNPNFGRIFPAETRAKMRASRLGMRGYISSEGKVKLGTAVRSRMLGTTHSAKQKRKISESVKKSLAALSEETKKRFSHKGAENGFFGKTHSQELRTKLSAARKANPHKRDALGRYIN